MTPAVHRVRELRVSYSPVRLCLPVPIAGRLSTPREAALLSGALLTDSHVERVIALHLNTKHRLVGVHTVAIGTLDAAIVHPRDVYTAAFLSNASGLIVTHNHPSGDPSPSRDDRTLVSRLQQAGELLGIELIDAIIVCDPVDGFAYYSFREMGVL